MIERLYVPVSIPMEYAQDGPAQVPKMLRQTLPRDGVIFSKRFTREALL